MNDLFLNPMNSKAQPMEPVTMSEVVDISQYEQVRPYFRAGALAVKERRRVAVGPAFTFLFENRITVLYQVQEMLRVERIVAPKAIEHEVKTYNELLPPAGSLGATLLIEYVDPDLRAEALVKLLGMENHVHLHVGSLPPVKGSFDLRQVDVHKVSAVQYLQFLLADEHRNEWMKAAAAGTVKMSVDHPFYSHESVLTESVTQALGEDLGVSELD